MKNILLLYPDMLFYKISIFNKLSVYLEQEGFKLIIWYTKIYDPNKERAFSFISDTPMTLKNYSRVIRENRIEAVINILFKKDPGFMFYIFSVLKPKSLRIPIIFYGHGIDMQKDKWWINILYNLTYFIFDGIILYTPAEKSKLWKRFHHKITFANNTLDMSSTDVLENREEIKTRYNINTPKVILTTGRLHSRKKIGILSEIFIKNYKNSSEVTWVLVGPDLNDEIYSAIKGIKNIHFLGPVYDRKKMAEIFSIADLYCVPGALGLGIVEAFYWGLPVLTTDVNHGPEAYYLKENYNSLIASDQEELAQMINEILRDDDKRKMLSENAKRAFSEEASLDKMFEGFNSQLNRFFNETVSTKYQKEIINA